MFGSPHSTGSRVAGPRWDGRVYRTIDTADDQAVAIKILPAAGQRHTDRLPCAAPSGNLPVWPVENIHPQVPGPQLISKCQPNDSIFG